MAESWGDVKGKWVPAIKEAVSLGEMEKLSRLRAKFPYSFENALNYLRREETGGNTGEVPIGIALT